MAGLDPLTLAAMASKAGIGMLQGLVGGGQKKKAREMAQANIRPDYRIQQPILGNNRLTESRAATGLSDASHQVYATQAERGLSSGIDAILSGGGSVNNIADLYGAYNTGISKMALVDDEMRVRNQRAYLESNNQLAGEMDKEWQINTWAPYINTAQAAATLAKQGSDSLWKGVNGVGSAVSDLAIANMYRQEGNNVFPQMSGGAMQQRSVDMTPAQTMGAFNPDVSTPAPIQSTALRPPLSPAQTVQQRFPGLSYPTGYSGYVWNPGAPIPQ